MDDEDSYEDDYEYEYSDEDDNDGYYDSCSTGSVEMNVEYDNPGNSQDDSQNANGGKKRMKSNLKDEKGGKSKNASDRNADNNPNAAPVRIASTKFSSGSAGELHSVSKFFESYVRKIHTEALALFEKAHSCGSSFLWRMMSPHERNRM